MNVGPVKGFAVALLLASLAGIEWIGSLRLSLRYQYNVMFVPTEITQSSTLVYSGVFALLSAVMPSKRSAP